MEQIAVSGGRPVRTKPLPPHPMMAEEEIEAVVEVLRSNLLTALSGQRVAEFEKEFAGYVGCKHGIAVNSGTAALQLALAGLDVGPGDEVILPPYTFVATANAILYNCAIPVFADINTETWTVDPDEVEQKITKRTAAIVPVHMLGRPAEMNQILEVAHRHGIPVVEDCAQSAGAKYRGQRVGSMGRLGCFSFQESKNMTTGEGGMIVTNDDELDEKIRSLRNHCRPAVSPYSNVDPENVFWGIGYNLRMAEMEAAVGLVQLKKLDEYNEKRRRNAAILTKAISSIEGLSPVREDPDIEHVYWEYGARVNAVKAKASRDQIMMTLRMEGIPADCYTPIPLHLQEFFVKKVGYGRTHYPFDNSLHDGQVEYKPGLCPKAEEIAKEDLLLPVYPALSDEDLQDIVTAIEKVTSYYRSGPQRLS
jgi:perosamine synthetase